MLFESVNRYALDGIVELSKTRSLEASADIFDDRGQKLWAKGNKVTADLREKLLRRKLAQPLEMTLTVEGALSLADVVDDCKRYLDQNPLFQRFLTRDALGILSAIRNVSLPQPMRLLITSAHANGSRNYSHALGTMLVSAGIAARLGAPERDSQHLLLAALLHDLGEMYVNPDYLKVAHRLEPSEWKHVASHPRIGQLLIEELTSLPSAVAQCVALHHERLDGSGYPNQVERGKHHRLGSWLAVADSVGAILARGDSGAPLRASLALRIVSDEFDQAAVNAVIQALRKTEDSYGSAADPSSLSAARATWNRLGATVDTAQALLGRATEPFVRKTVATALLLLNNLGKSLRATGAVEFEAFGAEALDVEVLAEISVILREIDWRMRNLARNIHIRAEAHENGSCLADLAPLIDALNGRKAPEQTIATLHSPAEPS